ncbi:MAG: hypothetical protein J6B62_02705 [Bacteroidales bacterium]|nr:hypothetical protein [Bacteroidales bacterium]
MKKIYNIFLMPLLLVLVPSCYGIDEENFKVLEPIAFNDVSPTIDVMNGEELVYGDLVVTSALPCTYEWAYGVKKSSASAGEYDMQSIQVISDKPDIRHTFTRVGQYILRLRVDNGESIAYKYFTLNVNSGLDEGVLILSNDEEGNGALTYIQNETDVEKSKVWDDIFTTINTDNTLVRATDMYLSSHTASGVTYKQLLVSTDDGRGSIYKLDPMSFALYNTMPLRELIGTSCLEFSGEATSGATYNYVFQVGADGKTLRYDLFADFVTERTDATASGEAKGSKMMISTTNRKPVLYNETTLFLPGYGKVTTQTLKGYNIVNFYSDRSKNVVYVLFRSQEDKDTYRIKTTTNTLGAFKDPPVNKADFSAPEMTMTEESALVTSLAAPNYIYYSNANKVYRFDIQSVAFASAPVVTLPDGETICDMATSYVVKGGSTGFEGTAGDNIKNERYLYIATYNENRTGDRKGSLYIYDFSTHELVVGYEGIFGRPVRVMYKSRV